MTVLPLSLCLRAALVVGSAVLALGGGVVRAQDAAHAPLVTPLHDADISYQLAGPSGAVVHQRMRWSSAGWRQRIDPEDAATIMLTDYRLHELMVLNTTDRTAIVTDAPGHAFSPPGTPASGSWRQVGPAHIAGENCTIWESADSDRKPTDFCYTADGLLLGATQGGHLVVRAISVSRAPQSSELFDPPPGYTRLQPGR